MPSAQGSSIKDVRIQATGAHTGVMGVPGRNSGVLNLEVEGGRYGVLVEGSVAGAVLVGLRLYRQVNRAVVFSDFVPTVMVGFEIVKATGPAVEVSSASSSAVGSSSLIDGAIELGSGTAVDDQAGKNLYLRNVFVKGGAAARCGAEAPLSGGGEWTLVKEYAYTSQAPATAPYAVGETTFASYAIVNGVKGRTPAPVKELASGPPPGDLISRHLYRELPSCEGQPGTLVATASPFNATADDATDDRAAIQEAIDAASGAGHGRVCLPRGEFQLGGPLVLRHNTVLFGISNKYSSLRTHDSWRPTSGMVWLIETDEAPDGTTFLGHLKTDVRTDGPGSPPAYDRFGHVRWRAGRHSVSIGLDLNNDWSVPNTPTNARHLTVFTGAGGGRHYFVKGEGYFGNGISAFRTVLISGTRQPLSLYGLNSETLGQPSPATTTEVLNAQNVRIYSTKREGGTPTLIVRDSQNIALYGSGAMRNASGRGLGGFIQILGSSNDVAIGPVNVQTVKSAANGEPVLREALAGKPELQVIWPEGVSIYKRGEVNDAIFSSDTGTCGDRLCGPGESCGLCPTDCGQCPDGGSPPSDGGGDPVDGGLPGPSDAGQPGPPPTGDDPNDGEPPPEPPVSPPGCQVMGGSTSSTLWLLALSLLLWLARARARSVPFTTTSPVPPDPGTPRVAGPPPHDGSRPGAKLLQR